MSETFDKVKIGNNFSEKFKVCSGIIQGDSLSPVLFNLTLEYVIKKVIHTEKDLNLNRYSKISLLGFVVLLGEDAETIKLNTGTLINASKEIGLEVNFDITKYTVSSRKIRDFGDIVLGGNKFEHVKCLSI